MSPCDSNKRSLTTEMVLKGTASLEIIESYADDKYLPSFLLRGIFEGRVFHVQIATGGVAKNVRIVTVYVPSPLEWDSDCRTRRVQS